MLAWTPPNSENGLGSVLLPRKPLKPLSPEEYRSALEQRLLGLVGFALETEGPERVLELLQKAQENEGLEISDPKQAASLLVSQSNWLLRRAGMPSQPVPPSEIKDSPETKEALEREPKEPGGLEEYLGLLYHDSE